MTKSELFAEFEANIELNPEQYQVNPFDNAGNVHLVNAFGDGEIEYINNGCDVTVTFGDGSVFLAESGCDF